MVKARSKKAKPQKIKEKDPKAKEQTRDAFDFGGLPDDVDFKRNLGCGG